MKTAHIAQLAHEVNRAYCAALGDDSQKPWADAPDWQKNSAMIGVELHLANPNAGPEASHESWMAQKLNDGWVYGEERDEDAKTHPCLVPFAELAIEQQVKDFLFRAAVHAANAMLAGYITIERAGANLATAVKAAKASSAPAVQSSVPAGMLPVKYIGKRPTYKDGTFQTGITFNQGETKNVPQAVALLMLNHKDVYAPGDAEDAPAAVAPVQSKPKDDDKDTEQSLQDARDLVSSMNDKDALISYAKTNFAGHQIHPNTGIDKLRQKVIGLIDQYGIEG